ncbi:hypothetical protein ACX93W_01265 [Paenibacillus sp. CAU 1782]
MEQDRRAIVLKEIQHWSRSKLLPEQYCEFLLNLYSDPETPRQAPQPNHAVGKAIAAVQRATGKQWLLTFGTFTLISFVVLYFSSFHPALQIGIVLLGTLAFLWFGHRFRDRSKAMSSMLVSVGALLLLGGGLHILELHELDAWGWKMGVLGGCALFWIIYGIWRKLPMLHLCGWLSSLVLYGWLLSRLDQVPAWYEVQLYWLPIAILFGWSSWFLHRFSKSVAAVMFVVCALAWFLPELYTQLVVHDSAWLQLQLIAKIALGGGLLFTLRKQWMVWVT